VNQYEKDRSFEQGLIVGFIAGCVFSLLSGIVAYEVLTSLYY